VLAAQGASQSLPAIRLREVRPGGRPWQFSAPSRPRGAREIYHYNSDGALDWGYFRINTLHLQRPGVKLRDLPDCKANIDFAYQPGERPSGAYRRFQRGQ
jgi:hypothetical protein